jgi:hypothetical protein
LTLLAPSALWVTPSLVGRLLAGKRNSAMTRYVLMIAAAIAAAVKPYV